MDYATLATILGISVTTLMLLTTIALWDSVWKLIALWKSARRKELAWFICLAIFNTVGILPILYIYVFSRKKKR